MDYYNQADVGEVSTDFFMALIIALISLITIIIGIFLIKKLIGGKK